MPMSPEQLAAVKKAQQDIERAQASIRMLGEFFGNGDGPNASVYAKRWEWMADQLSPTLSELWAMEDDIPRLPGIALYGRGPRWPRHESRPLTNEEMQARQKRDNALRALMENGS